MDILVSAVVSDLISRCGSFLLKKCRRQPGAEESLPRLRRLLLRADAIVEEAQGRRITNQAMLRQLKMLMEGFYRGQFMLDAFSKFPCLPEGGAGDGTEEEDSSHASAQSKLCLVKRVRSSGGSGTTKMMLSGGNSATGLQEMADYLESVIADMEEFVVFLGLYPRLPRQPYCAYVLMENCMFGRQMERERVMSFLLRPEAPGAENLAVLPIVGPNRVGKSTLVEHVCRDELVRDRFSTILFFREKNISSVGAVTESGLGGRGVVKHQNSSAAQKRLLIVVELAGDIDDETWRRVACSGTRPAGGSRIIVTSRSDKIARLGTTGPLRLNDLPPEAYWHFFKTLAFGSADPDAQPALASMALEIAMEQRQCLVSGAILAGLLRDNPDARFWRAVVRRVRAYKEPVREEEPVYYRRLAGSSGYFLIRDYYQTDSALEGAAVVDAKDLLVGDAPRGRFEALAWKSRLPPYYNYMISCEMEEPGGVAGRTKRKAVDFSSGLCEITE